MFKKISLLFSKNILTYHKNIQQKEKTIALTFVTLFALLPSLANFFFSLKLKSKLNCNYLKTSSTNKRLFKVWNQ